MDTAIDNAIPLEESAFGPVFWGEIAPCEHLLQIYADDEILVEALAGFVLGGLRNNNGAAVVIATPPHLASLEARLRASGVDVDEAAAHDRYLALVAQDVLDRFMVDGWPDEARFHETVDRILTRARGPGRPVRAFGEMVALLWARGDQAATVRLEYLWNKVLKSGRFPLFCAYPRAGFTQDAPLSVHAICAAHTRVLAG